MTEWQDIASAPKDGTPILVARTIPYDNNGAVEICWWDGQWCPYNRSPTHWMPLPAHPNQDKASS